MRSGRAPLARDDGNCLRIFKVDFRFHRHASVEEDSIMSDLGFGADRSMPIPTRFRRVTRIGDSPRRTRLRLFRRVTDLPL
ncbi:hypothetical protein WJ96_30590 [Burkholderia ubonensis]|uniref:Uncharacterized protein n=1 Tax=Burkholderia ubonensis TaxID=101571 RepID=A0AAW3N2S5_9BURK|nr:hypothetical protein WJ45_04565 [Burkholderia ubonensis]KVQ02937.1 hypothetical protein WJ96_30590 [Burkholderia ubonensis]KVQ59807.1 hypothetical protein WK04_27660 [Burkholderia ubonensis]KWA02738.1 hypothetical protein WL25_02835 [Burkholderia ubonensis]